MKYYVVSDLHGFFQEFMDALNCAGYFEDKEPHKLIILGDFFDRGGEAKKMQQFLLENLDNPDVILVRGNHEDLINEFLYENYRLYPILEESHHFRNSTVDTVCQLLDISLDEFKSDIHGYIEKAKRLPLIRYIIPLTRDYYETKNYIFVHGYIPCDVFEYGNKPTDVYKYRPDWREASKTDWTYARWYNGMRANHDGVKEKTIVCGHWHCSFGHCYYEHDGSEFDSDANFTPYIADGIIAIDGCIPRSFHCNCVVLEDEELDSK